MRLWHEDLITKLPRQQLLGQHRECCALRGRGWGRPHSVVNYVFTHSPDYLYSYHCLVMDEMERRGYHPDSIWRNPNYRGSAIDIQEDWVKEKIKSPIYPEHDNKYLNECLKNLEKKGIFI